MSETYDLKDDLVISSSPHLHVGSSVQRIMLDVIIALVPCCVAAFLIFGARICGLIAVCCAATVLTEWLCRKLMRRANTIGDLSALLTGLLLALNLPSSLPLWQAALGSVVAIALAKQVFGGLGYNPFNPALIGRAFLLISFTAEMTTWSESAWVADLSYNSTTSATALELREADGETFVVNVQDSKYNGTTTATPLMLLKAASKHGVKPSFKYTNDVRKNLFLGRMNGSIGEVSSLAILLGAIWLLYRRVITWYIPVGFIGSAALYAWLFGIAFPSIAMPVDFHLLTGGLLFGAFFMATDMVTTPITYGGQFIFGVGCGILTMIIRTVPGGAYPEGVSFAILIMNAFTPLINKAIKKTRRPGYGHSAKKVCGRGA